MLGAGLQFNRGGNAEDRFYSAVRARLSQECLRRAQSDVTSNRSRSLPDEPPTEGLKPEVPPSPPASEPSPLCNLERFLESVIPSVPAQHLSKLKLRAWRTSDVDFHSFFLLSDLWESYKEWSAYGVGVPLILNEHDGVVQYYVPYLSGIQLFVDPSKSTEKLRQPGDESDSETFVDSCSDRSSDNEQERGGSCSAKQPDCIQTNHSTLRVDHLSMNGQHVAFQEGSSSDESESGSSQCILLFEYLERDQPYCREPLANKISDLALCFPKLKTLRSCDLLPSSWISVAWYPIYRIPTGPTLRDLDACFLTYHFLHTPLTGNMDKHPTIVSYPNGSDSVPQISLPVFGLASYKYRSQLWTPVTDHQHHLARSLLQVADNWLSMLQVYHPDFAFFCRR